MYTAREGNYQATKLMIVNNASVNMKTNDDDTALLMAFYKAKTLNIEIVRLLLENGADANARDTRGRTCLMSKVMNSEAAQLLLDYKADINIKDSKGLTALHSATAKSNIKVVSILLENGADPDIKDDDGVSPLFEAELNDDEKMKKLLLEKGAAPLDENQRKKIPNNKLLRVCLPQSFTPTVKVDLKELKRLLGAGADVNYMSDRSVLENKNYTCLMRMARKGDVEATRILFDNKADPNIQDYLGWTALHQAVYYGHIGIVGLLLENGADPDIKSNIGFSPLLITELFGMSKMKKLLLKLGASPLDENEKQTLNNNKLIKICYLRTNDPLLSILVASKRRKNYDDRDSELDHEELDRLLEAGVDINFKDRASNDNTCLILISGNGGVEDVKKVLDSKADVNLKGEKGKTALHIASVRGNNDVVQLLLEYGADPKIKDNKGRTAFQVTKYKNTEKILLKAAATTTDNMDDDVNDDPGDGDGETDRKIVVDTEA